VIFWLIGNFCGLAEVCVNSQVLSFIVYLYSPMVIETVDGGLGFCRGFRCCDRRGFSIFYRDYRNLQGAPYADGWLLGWLMKIHCVFFCAMFGSLRLYV
jgi:hypothetical protein